MRTIISYFKSLNKNSTTAYDVWDRHKNVVALNLLMGSLPSTIFVHVFYALCSTSLSCIKNNNWKDKVITLKLNWYRNRQPFNHCQFDWFSLISQVGFLKKSSFKESSDILLLFSSTYLFTLFQGRWIQKSMLAILKMSFNVTKWLPKKQHLRTNHIRHCSLMDPVRVGMLE